MISLEHVSKSFYGGEHCAAGDVWEADRVQAEKLGEHRETDARRNLGTAGFENDSRQQHD